LGPTAVFWKGIDENLPEIISVPFKTAGEFTKPLPQIKQRHLGQQANL